MRRTLITLFLVAGVAVAPQGASASIKSKNRLDHVRYYQTCATCPRGVVQSTYTVYDAGDVFCNDRKAIGKGYDRVGWYLFSFWQRGRMCFNPPNQKKSMTWDQGSGAGNQDWNNWQEQPAQREIHPSGKKCHATTWGGVRCYRRTEFVFEASYQAWTFNENDWVSQSFFTDGSYGSGHSGS